MTKQLSKALKEVGKCDKELNNLCDEAGAGKQREQCSGDCQQSKPGGQSSRRFLSGSELEPDLETGLLLQVLQSIRLDREERLNAFGKHLW